MKVTRQNPRYLFLLLVGACAVGCFPGCLRDGSSPANSEDWESSIEPPKFSDEVRNILDQKTQLVQGLAAQDRIVSAVNTANEENKALSEPEVSARDAHWRATKGLDDFIKPFLTNDCAEALIEFQEANDAFSELLVTDSRGLLVAASNKSSDYLQADEPWWVAAFDEGRGRSHTGPIEYDESARSEAISVYVPILDPKDNRAIGVIKAVCDVTAIKLEL